MSLSTQTETRRARRRGTILPEMPINQTLGDQASLEQHLPFSMNLVSFIRDRQKGNRFAFGHWLATLTDSRLDDVLEAYRIFSTTDVRDAESAPVRNDMLTLLMTALLHESGKRSMNMHTKKMPGHIDSMGVVIRVETWRRKGWVTLTGDLAIHQRKACGVIPTGLMREAAPETYWMIKGDSH